eukprot:TRINITY_DN7121_c0_g1_i1.p1 TRINITY_DN7121_c0_g1~~TRINITY_DN7121_c0_g1_i1.p1  ORF type:complete len:525 (+),score=233.87 TRINITY_DN7121_c0_g1_i1:95-1669(+)
MYGEKRINIRKKSYKKGLADVEDSRRKREENRYSLRKKKREEQLLKKRFMGFEDDNTPQLTPEEIEKQLAKLGEFAQGCNSENEDEQLHCVTSIRQLLSIELNPPINQVIASNVVPRLVYFLQYSNNPKIKFESAWALTNIASGSHEQTLYLLHNGAVQAFVEVLNSAFDISVKEQAVWALGNIAGDSYHCRDFVLQHDVLPGLVELTKENIKTSLRRNAVWTISNLCRGKPAPPFESIKPVLPVLSDLLTANDQRIIIDSCWAISYISDGDNLKIQAILEADICRRVVELLIHQSPSIKTPALRVVGNIVTGDDIQTQFIINCQALPRLGQLLKSPRKSIRKEVCWTLSNITAGTPRQIQAVIDSGLIPLLISHLSTSEFDIRKEAAWAIANATSSGNKNQVQVLVEEGCIPPLCELLYAPDARVIAVALEGLENIIEFGEEDKIQNGTNEYISLIEEADGVEKIESLQSHPNRSIFGKATSIIDKYFSKNEEEDQNITPNITSDQSSYSFGSSSDNHGGFQF